MTPDASNTTTSRDRAAEPGLPHEHDESSHGQRRATPEQDKQGRRAFGNATDGMQDTDRGPVLDKVYNEKVAPGRGGDVKPRR